MAALALIPIVFTRDTLNNFEFPKSALLVTVGLFIVGSWVAAESASAAAQGILPWVRSLPRRALVSARSDPAGAAVYLFLASAIASTVASINPIVSLVGAEDSYSGLPVVLATAAVYFASRSLAASTGWLRQVAVAAAIAAASGSTYALLQLLGMDPLPWGGKASFGGEVRIFGTLGHPNILGGYLVMTLPLVAWLRSTVSSRGLRIVLSFVIATSFAVVIATLSRGAWLAAMACAAAWLVLTWRAARERRGTDPGPSSTAPAGSARVLTWAGMILLGLILLIPAIATLGPNLTRRIREIGAVSAPTTRSRLEIWRAAAQMTADHPLFGVGVDAFPLAFPLYRTREYWSVEWGGTPRKAHNEALQIVSTQGVFGGIAALLVVVLVARGVWRAAGTGSAEVQCGTIAVGAALAAFAVQGVTNFTTVASAALAAALAGWASRVSTSPSRNPATQEQTRRSSFGLLAGTALALILFVPLVLLPWLAERSAYEALTQFLSSPDRENGLRRAARLAPWDARYPGKLGTGFLVQATREPDPERRWFLLGSAYEYLQRALEIQPELPFERACLGQTIAMQSQLHPESVSLSRAQSVFAEARRRDPANALILLQESETLLGLNREDLAREPALRAVALYPDLAKPFADLGAAALRAGRTQGAADTLRLAVARDFRGDEAGRTGAWINLARAYLTLGQSAESLGAAEQALALTPGQPEALEYRDAALRALGRSP